MVRVIVALVAALWMGTATAGTKSFDKHEAMINACLMTQYYCAHIPAPKVKYVSLRPGLLGYYDGGDTIYVRRGLRGTQRKEVLLHETIHYIQVQIGGAKVPGPAESICKLEEEAFRVTDEWLISIGYKPVGKNWWKPYSHCHQWYDPDWKPRSIRRWWGGLGI